MRFSESTRFSVFSVLLQFSTSFSVLMRIYVLARFRSDVFCCAGEDLLVGVVLCADTIFVLVRISTLPKNGCLFGTTVAAVLLIRYYCDCGFAYSVLLWLRFCYSVLL